MTKSIFRIATLFLLILLSIPTISAQQSEFKTDFSNANIPLKTIGRGINKIENGVLKSKDAYASFGNANWKNYTVQFKARAPKGAEQVQIWAGFRAFNRNDRYVVGIRGGLQNNLYLSRMGYMGADEFLGLRPLNFKPQVGVWYDVKIEVCGNRIRVFVNNEAKPYIDVVDNNSSLAPTGEVTLGGSWIETEFDDLHITQLPDNYLKNTSVVEFAAKISEKVKEKKRIEQRAAYKHIAIGDFKDGRTEISLNGEWLFMPENELKEPKTAAHANLNDNNWHTMTVPNFGIPRAFGCMAKLSMDMPRGYLTNIFQQETDRCANYTFDYLTTKVAWYRQWVELPTDLKSKTHKLGV
jgi:hypothetical protein